ncbi:NfeD family protein [Candidatus Dependentiae bacterium]|nr:NfeD family protein [Candidatus Dependentiae bacterium]
MTKFWFIISAFFIFIEILNPGLFFFLALALGALTTMLTEYQNNLPINQYIFFFIASGAMFLLLNLMVKFLQKKKQSKFYESNMYLMIGKIVEITEIISDDTGYAQVDGELWMVKLQKKEEKLIIEQKALVIGVKGCHLQINLLHD